jgi:hypothetical protein
MDCFKRSKSKVPSKRNQTEPGVYPSIVAGGEKAGYVPRPFSALVSRLLDAGVKLEARAVRQLGDPADVGRWVVGLSRT